MMIWGSNLWKHWEKSMERSGKAMVFKVGSFTNGGGSASRLVYRKGMLCIETYITLVDV